MAPRRAPSDTRAHQKVAALVAAGVVLAAGATVTSLAAWTDTEWIFGGAGSGSGVSTSTFEVNQNVTTNDANWTNDLANPGGNVNFGLSAAQLTPGDSVYGYVRLRTPIASVGGALTLNGAVLGGTGGSQPLFDALRYQAKIVPTPADCSSTGMAASTTNLVGSPTPATLTTSSAAGAFTLAAGTATVPGAEKVVCFALTLPNGSPDTLQGLTALPVWNFSASSS